MTGKKNGGRMKIKISYLGAFLPALMIFFNLSYAIDFWSMADQSTYRCPGGVVAIGDSDRAVLVTRK